MLQCSVYLTSSLDRGWWRSSSLTTASRCRRSKSGTRYGAISRGSKVPRQLWFVPSLERTPSGKLDYERLRAMVDTFQRGMHR